jgi:hypothetical protein
VVESEEASEHSSEEESEDELPPPKGFVERFRRRLFPPKPKVKRPKGDLAAAFPGDRLTVGLGAPADPDAPEKVRPRPGRTRLLAARDSAVSRAAARAQTPEELEEERKKKEAEEAAKQSATLLGSLKQGLGKVAGQFAAGKAKKPEKHDELLDDYGSLSDARPARPRPAPRANHTGPPSRVAGSDAGGRLSAGRGGRGVPDLADAPQPRLQPDRGAA